MSRLFMFVNIIFVLLATTTALAGHNPKPKPMPNQKPRTFVLPVFKDNGNYYNPKYYTNVTIGEPPLVISLDIAMSGDSLWFPCDNINYNSTTSTNIHCGSRKCKQAKGECTTCSYGPYCRNNTCVSPLYYGTSSELLEDNVILSYTSTSANVAHKLKARVPLACLAPYSGTDYIAYTGSRGFLGLSTGSMSFVNSLVSSYKIPFKAALCLPSKHGVNDSGSLYIGGGPYMLPPNGKDVSGLLVSTPLIRLIREDSEDTYHIDVKSIEVNGETLSFNRNLLTLNKSSGSEGTLINEWTTYTHLESSIYKALVNAFSRYGKKRKAVVPFDNCFSSKSFGGKSFLEKKTPVISLVLGGGVKWNIYGSNSLVKVSKSVVCLAFMASESGYTPSIMIGGYQMQDNLLEYDLEASKFSFSSSLLIHNTSCTQQLNYDGT